MNVFFSILRICLVFLIMQNACASIQDANKDIAELYHQLTNYSKLTMSERLEFISRYFLNKPYVLGALGEGPNGRFDQSPLYRTDGFDCETFVDTVVALALGENFTVFKQCINDIRYLKGKADFIGRNHFISLDWNLNNQQQGFVKDITLSIRNENNIRIAETASALIDKSGWYEHLDKTHIKLQSPNDEEQAQRLEELQLLGSKLPKTQANIPYLPLTELFFQNGNPNMAIFQQIPSGAIIEIVRPNWDLREKIGTCLNVSHLGFAFRKENELIFRQASSEENKVIDVSLIDYLRKARASPTIKGINVQVIIPQQPFKKNCGVELASGIKLQSKFQ